MTKKIFKSIILVAGTILMASMIIIMGCLYDYFEGVRERGLTPVRACHGGRGG